MGWIILVIVILWIYFLPTIIGRDKKNSTAIFVLNLFLGWTLVGWVIALVWAATYENSSSSGFDKKCPFCAESVKREAIVCRYCGRDLPVSVEQ